MEKVPDVLSRWRDTGLFAGTSAWIAIAFTIGRADPWLVYFQCAAVLAVAWWPLLAVTWLREASGGNRFEGKNRLRWKWAFLGYWPLLMLLSAAMIEAGKWEWAAVFTAGICFASLEALLWFESRYLTRLLTLSRLRKISPEKAVLLSITGLAVLLGAMAVSSMDDPAYHSDKQLLIGFELRLEKLMRSFPQFVSISVQLLTMYLAGFFFFYLNSQWLVPRILKRNGILLYLLCAAAVIGICYPFWGQLLTSLPLSHLLGGVFASNPFVAENAFGAVLVILASLPILLAIQWSKQNSLITALQHEKSLAELDLLKQQLNPHFFFNTLNNLYALSLQRSHQTPESILQLSDLMRYVIYKANNPVVGIGDEVSYLEDYLQLQQIRLKRKLRFRFDKDIADPSASVAPLLLIVLVENAFKHGVEPAENEAFLEMTLRVTADQLVFLCKNSVEIPLDTTTGIGLTNLRKRLVLLYPGRHRLHTSSENAVFTAELEINLL